MLPYLDGKKESFWSSGVRASLENYQKVSIDNLFYLIKRDTTVSAAGSCFAQHIGKNLLKRKYKFILSQYSKNKFQSFGLGNIYTARQLRQWLEFCNKTRHWSKNTFFKDANDKFFDYLIPEREPVNSLDILNKNRDKIAEEIISNLCETDVFIFTCGLTEACQTSTGEVLAIAPGTLFGTYDPMTFQFINFDYVEVRNELMEIEKCIVQINPQVKFIYTVSPVPLTATSMPEHVLIANNYSKSTLRAAVGDHVKSSQKSFYFPSYELITHNTLGDWRFEKNLRSVAEKGVEFVMRHGFGEKKEGENVVNPKTELNENREIHCEEEKIETLNRIKKSNSDCSEIFLIGDSHFGKYAKYLDKFGVNLMEGKL